MSTVSHYKASNIYLLDKSIAHDMLCLEVQMIIYRIVKEIGPRRDLVDGFCRTKKEANAHIEKRMKELRKQFPGQFIWMYSEQLKVSKYEADQLLNG